VNIFKFFFYIKTFINILLLLFFCKFRSGACKWKPVSVFKGEGKVGLLFFYYIRTFINVLLLLFFINFGLEFGFEEVSISKGGNWSFFLFFLCKNIY
jgi:hypothetical protein